MKLREKFFTWLTFAKEDHFKKKDQWRAWGDSLAYEIKALPKSAIADFFLQNDEKGNNLLQLFVSDAFPPSVETDRIEEIFIFPALNKLKKDSECFKAALKHVNEDGNNFLMLAAIQKRPSLGKVVKSIFSELNDILPQVNGKGENFIELILTSGTDFFIRFCEFYKDQKNLIALLTMKNTRLQKDKMFKQSTIAKIMESPEISTENIKAMLLMLDEKSLIEYLNESRQKAIQFSSPAKEALAAVSAKFFLQRFLNKKENMELLSLLRAYAVLNKNFFTDHLISYITNHLDDDTKKLAFDYCCGVGMPGSLVFSILQEKTPHFKLFIDPFTTVNANLIKMQDASEMAFLTEDETFELVSKDTSCYLQQP